MTIIYLFRFVYFKRCLCVCVCWLFVFRVRICISLWRWWWLVVASDWFVFGYHPQWCSVLVSTCFYSVCWVGIAFSVLWWWCPHLNGSRFIHIHFSNVPFSAFLTLFSVHCYCCFYSSLPRFFFHTHVGYCSFSLDYLIVSSVSLLSFVCAEWERERKFICVYDCV